MQSAKYNRTHEKKETMNKSWNKNNPEGLLVNLEKQITHLCLAVTPFWINESLESQK